MRHITSCVSGLALLCIAAFALAAAAEADRSSKGFSELYTFCQKTSCSDGQNPYGSLLADSSGNLYGTTANGGVYGGGTVFKITPKGKEKVLYSFCAQQNCTDGQQPNSNLIQDAAGNLYGTTYFGGTSSGGTVFELASDGTETVLYSFGDLNGKYGNNPVAGLVMDKQGRIYGTTRFGGTNAGGVVFKLSGGKESVLYSFCSQTNCADGASPIAGLLLKGGDLYGTTAGGGAHAGGTVFRVSTKGAESVLYSFCAQQNCPDGETPVAGLVADNSGDVYGTTQYGGANGYGTVFEVSSGGGETVLYSFSGGSDGSWPIAGLLLKSSKAGISLFGTTERGGTGGNGTAFEVSGGQIKVLHAFTNDACATPAAGLVLVNGKFYGTSSGTGGPNNGCVFKLGTQGGTRH